jgi:hypothetical protein
LCCCWLFTGAAGFIASIGIRGDFAVNLAAPCDQGLRTHLDGLLGLGCNGLSGLGGGFHLGGECKDILGERGEGGLSAAGGKD